MTISLTGIVVAMGVICLIDWWMLLRTTIKHDRELGQASQPNYGHSTYYIIFAQLLAVILVAVAYFIASPFIHTTFHTSNLWLLAGVYAVVYAVYKIVVAIVQTIFNFIIIEATSARYKKESENEK